MVVDRYFELDDLEVLASCCPLEVGFLRTDVDLVDRTGEGVVPVETFTHDFVLDLSESGDNTTLTGIDDDEWLEDKEQDEQDEGEDGSTDSEECES